MGNARESLSMMFADVRAAAYNALLRRRMQRRLAAFRRTFVPLPQHTIDHKVKSADRSGICVVVPCFNHSQYLKTTILSLAAQTTPPREVIFVNDCSTDDTLNVLSSTIRTSGLESRSHCVILDNPSNMGQAASLNRGIAASREEIIMVLNDDDCLFHDSVELALRVFHAYPDLCLVGGRCIDFDSGTALDLYQKELLKVWNFDAIGIRIFHPGEVLTFTHQNDLNTPHSGTSFLKFAWSTVGGYIVPKEKRVVPFADRDFQFRVNLLFSVGLLHCPISFWRSNSSVDTGIFS